MTGYNRVLAKYYHDLKRSADALIGIAQDILCDHHINDDEIRFLNDGSTLTRQSLKIR
jgi:hypothetical protein